MQTVSFQCGHCGNLMAVEEQYLGHQVQCPHCQQVVQTSAPAPAAAPTSAPNETPFFLMRGGKPNTEPAGHIPLDPNFGIPPSQPSMQPLSTEAIPSPPSTSKVEMVPMSPETPYNPESPAASAASNSGVQSSSPCLPATAVGAQAFGMDALAFEAGLSQQPSSFSTSSGPLTMSPQGDSGTNLATEAFASVPPRHVAYRGMKGGIFIALVLIPLISYSILATIAVLVLYFRPPPPHPMEYLPDLEGDFKGGKHQKQGAVSFERINPESELPPRLQVSLGHSLRLGELEVAPQRIERRRVKIRVPGFAAEPGIDDSLVLHLLLENTSQDQVFCPTDPFFDRSWKNAASGRKPYTFLEIGEHRFFGPMTYKADPKQPLRESIEGQHHKVLEPGEKVSTLVCTAPQDRVGKFLANYHGRLLWRIQLRRGLVQVGDREVSATSVVGVSFTEKDIHTNDM